MAASRSVAFAGKLAPLRGVARRLIASVPTKVAKPRVLSLATATVWPASGLRKDWFSVTTCEAIATTACVIARLPKYTDPAASETSWPSSLSTLPLGSTPTSLISRLNGVLLTMLMRAWPWASARPLP